MNIKLYKLRVNAKIISLLNEDSDSYAQKFEVQFLFKQKKYLAEVKTFFYVKKTIDDIIQININPKNISKVKYFGSNNRHFYKGLLIDIFIFLFLFISNLIMFI